MRYDKQKKFAILIIIRLYFVFLLSKLSTMNIEFNDNALEELYVSGNTSDSKYKRLPKNIVKQYVKVVNYLRAAPGIEHLYQIKSLHYKKKEGNLKGMEAVWINTQYRLLFRSSPDKQSIIVNILLIEISKHYE